MPPRFKRSASAAAFRVLLAGFELAGGTFLIFWAASWPFTWFRDVVILVGIFSIVVGTLLVYSET